VSRAELGAVVPSLVAATGGAVLLLLVGDIARVEAKYGERAERFLLLEAGHLMQTLALTALAEGLALLPLGGVLEESFEDALCLLPTDLVLYAGLLGKP
jgi:nitroreductase